MDMFLEVLKWVGIALAAGFVGYFGRYPAKILLEKISGARKTTPEKPPEKQAEKQADGGQIELEKKRLKVEKKATKQAVKAAKKAGKKENGIS